jgi:hypothetical protein
MMTDAESRDQRRFWLVLIGVYLLLSVHGVVQLPMWERPGLDLQNLHAFHSNCGGWPIPYGRAGAECGDWTGRPMVYPPLVYWAMAWTRFFDFYFAELLWSLAIIALTAFGMANLARLERKLTSWQVLFGMLLFLQLPVAYAVERGNCDALIVATGAIAIACFARGKFALAGAAMAAAAWMKVYPAIPAIVLLAAIASDPGLRRSFLKPLFLGFAGTGLALALLLLPDSYRYVAEVLPRFAAERGGILPSSHILYKSVWAWLFLKLPILVLWGRLARRHLERDPLVVLSGLLAISTFFQNTSNDYNLVTAYPFLFLLFARLLRPGARSGDFWMMLLTLVAFVGDRSPWIPLFANRGALYFQIVWLVSFPLFMGKRIDKGLWADGNLQLR